MAVDHSEKLVVPVFKVIPRLNKAKTAEAGRPIYEDQEVVEVRYPGNRQTVSVFPAHSFSNWVVDESGNQVQQTYAERWSDNYRRFKSKQHQVADGTPVSELPFLTEAKRSELRALNIHTAEALAAVDGQELKNLGQGGRDLKNQAQAYLDNASGSATATRQAAEIEELKRRIAELESGDKSDDAKKSRASAKSDDNSDDDEDEDVTDEERKGIALTDAAIEACTDEELKAYIKRESGSGVRGTPNRETLVTRAREIAREIEREAKKDG